MKRPFTLRLPDGKKYEFLADDWHDAQEIITEWLTEDCTRHKFNNGVCKLCGFECEHEYKEKMESGLGKYCGDCGVEFSFAEEKEAYWMDRGMDERRGV